MTTSPDEMQAQAVAELNASTGTDHFHVVSVKDAWGAHGLDPRIGASQASSWIVPPLGAPTPFSAFMHPAPAGWRAVAGALDAALG